MDTELVESVIRLAQEVREARPVRPPGYNGVSLAAAAAALTSQSPAAARLDQFLNGLTPGERQGLVALYWIGRGNDFISYRQAVRWAGTLPDDVRAGYLAGMWQLGEHLRRGLVRWHRLHARPWRTRDET